jgi:hypothetical protein
MDRYQSLRSHGHGAFHLETAAKLLISLEAIFGIFSKCTLKSLNNQTDFDSAIRRFGQATRWGRKFKILRPAPMFIWQSSIWKSAASSATRTQSQPAHPSASDLQQSSFSCTAHVEADKGGGWPAARRKPDRLTGSFVSLSSSVRLRRSDGFVLATGRALVEICRQIAAGPKACKAHNYTNNRQRQSQNPAEDPL